jgi:hypothetical protein
MPAGRTTMLCWVQYAVFVIILCRNGCSGRVDQLGSRGGMARIFSHNECNSVTNVANAVGTEHRTVGPLSG